MPVTRADPTVVPRVLEAAAARLAPGARIVVGLSGGLDSVVLLHALAACAPARALRVSALHVHHGLSPNADGWAEFCMRCCGQLRVELAVVRVEVSDRAALGIERAARRARYRAYGASGADLVALAHHADDQAETVLLQLFRGAGPAGLAAMPEARPADAGPGYWRPLLPLPRTSLLAYARAHQLRWIEDESNADPAFARNLLRLEVFPRLERAFPGYRRTLARAALNAADADRLTADLAQLDLRGCIDGSALRVGPLLALAPVRQANAVRHWLRAQGADPPRREALLQFLDQAAVGAPQGRPTLVLGQGRLVRERGRLLWYAAGRSDPGWSVCWTGEPRVALPDGRVLDFEPAVGEGIDRAAVPSGGLQVRFRREGDRLRLGPDRPTRTLKNLFQERDVPPSERERWPLLCAGGRVVWIPGIGGDPEVVAPRGAAGLLPRIVAPPRDGMGASPDCRGAQPGAP